MKRVLIVEDDAIIANIYQRKLQMESFQVQHALDGELAIEAVKTNPPDIILLDLQLPKKNGIEVLEFVRSNEPTKNTPVVVFTNSYLGSLVQSAWKAGANKCLTKAICTPKQVADVLKATLAGKDLPTPAGDTAAANSTKPAGANDSSLLSGLLRMTTDNKPKPRPSPKSSADSISMGDIPLKMDGGDTPAAKKQDSDAIKLPSLDGLKIEGGDAAPVRMPKAAASQQGEFVAPTSTDTLDDVELHFQGELKKGFAETLPQAMSTLRQKLQQFIKNENDSSSLRWMEERSAILFDMYRKMHSVTAGAGVAGCQQIARVAAAFEALLTELSENPSQINPSTVRTVAHTVDFLSVLFGKVNEPDSIDLAKSRVLVVDDEPLSRKAVMRGLEKAELDAVDVADPKIAAEMAEKEHFDLIFLDIEMPGMDGFDLCKKIRANEMNAKSPIVFVTSLTDFMSRAKSSLSGGNDLIAKPFLVVELAVKALTFLIKGDVQPAPKVPS